MTDFESAARITANQLEELEVQYALVGGFAVSILTEPRFTRDIDLVVAVDGDDGAEAVIWELVQNGYEVLAAVEQEVADRLATVRLALRTGDDIVDLIFASSGIEPEIAALAQPMEVLPTLVLPVARVGHLIALKLLASDERTRPQDSVDLRALLAVAGTDDVDLARQAVRQIEDRGYQRGRNLVSSLENLLKLR